MTALRLGSLFDGVGVFPLAAVRCGIEPVWASEIEKAPISITTRHFPDMAHLGDATKLDGRELPSVHTKRMVAELIDHIEVYHAEKQDGITNQRVVIHYNCIGAFDVPDRRKIPEADIIMETRKGVALSYAPEQVAV